MPACRGSSLRPSTQPKKYPRYRDRDCRHSADLLQRLVRPITSKKEDRKNRAARLSHPCRPACWHALPPWTRTIPAKDLCWNRALGELRVSDRVRALPQSQGQGCPTDISPARVRAHSNTSAGKQLLFQENPAWWWPA